MESTSNERYVFCGGYSPPKFTGKNKPIHLNLWGKDRNVTLKISDISKKMAAEVPSIFVDLLEIATYVYCADQAMTRGGNRDRSFGRRWRRHFRFFIPVRNPKIWSSNEVLEVLQDTLGFLSDDEYEFTFAKLSRPPPVALYFDFGVGPGSGFSVDEVVLFSGGLDSFAGAVQESITHKHNVALVSHRSTPKIFSKQRDLARELSSRGGRAGRPFHVPVWIHKDQALTHEFTQRTRSFLYASLGATTAAMFKLSRIRIYENGIVSFNLPISAQVIGARATRVTHPRSLTGFARLFGLLAEGEFEVENPFLWKTKAEVVRLVGDAGCADLIKHTASCSGVRERTKLSTHCGVCSQCIDRRFGTLATGYGRHDPPEMYKIDLLTGDLKPGEQRTMVESYVRTAQEIDEMSDDEFFERFGEINRVWPYLGGSTNDNATKVLDLHRRHSKEVVGVLNDAFSKHAGNIQKGRLRSSCLLILNIPEKYRTIYRPPGKENVFRKEGQLWCICYEGKAVYLKDCKGLVYISCLVGSPNKAFCAPEIRSLVIGNTETLFLGSAGEVADQQAIREYGFRLADLEKKLGEAKTGNDLSQVSTILKEKKALKKQISYATGLGGRPRRVSDDYERARKSVWAAITRSMTVIKQQHPALWQHLQNSLRVGILLRYSPERPIFWNT